MANILVFSVEFVLKCLPGSIFGVEIVIMRPSEVYTTYGVFSYVDIADIYWLSLKA